MCFNKFEKNKDLKIFKWLKKNDISDKEMLKTFNCGVGFCLIIDLLIIFAEIIVVLMIASILLYNAFETGIFLIFFFVINVYFFQLITKSKLKSWGEIVLKLSTKIIKIFHESIYGIKVIKIFGREEYFINEFKSLGNKLSFVKRNKVFFANLPRIWLELICIVSLSILMFFLINQNHDISNMFSIIGMFVVAAFRLMPSANRILNSINLIREATSTTKLLINEFNKNIKIKHPITNDEILFKKSISLKNISFKYPNTTNNVLENINLDIKKGSCIGFIGKSGAGKSTLIDLLIGLLIPSNGLILVDNKIINPSSRSWQKLIGYVSQTIYLSDDTIRKNIAFGLYEKEINSELLKYSIEASQLEEFITSLPNNIETFVGDYGVRLSGGQRQRIALARALYLNPPILVFDEATSSLDSRTEVEIMSAIKKLKGEKTIFIIAHRLSTLEYCDEIYELKNNKLLPK